MSFSKPASTASTMAGLGRVGDIGQTPSDAHGHPCCPHVASGAATHGSSDVFVEDRAALRLGDGGTQRCCGAATWRAATGAKGVFINDLPVHRAGDQTLHCGGHGILSGGSATVLIGNYHQPGADPCMQPKLHAQISYPGGDPLAHAAYEVYDSAGQLVHSGVLDAEGRLQLPSPTWGVYLICLSNGWRLQLG